MRLAERPVRIDVCGVTLDVETDHPELTHYLEQHFSHVTTPAAAGAADIVVRVRWTDGPRAALRPETVFPDWQVDTMIDRHVHVGPNRVMWLRVDDVASLALASENAGDTRRFELRFHFSLGTRGWRERLKRAVYWRKLPALRRSRLSTLTYYAVYYPAWWQLESRGAGSSSILIFPASHAVTRAREGDAGGSPRSGGGLTGELEGSTTTRSYPGNRGSASVGGTSESASSLTAAGTTRAWGGAVSAS